MNKIATILFYTLVIALLVLGLRGIPGSPTAETLGNPEWRDDGPLELSPDRGRFALLYSVVEDHSVQFSLPIARFATPDLAISPSGQYVSLFAPAVSFIVIPGYVIGKALGASQLGTFVVIAFFAFLNLLLIRAIAVRLGANIYSASFAALAFLFASPAYTYAVTLYQHHISTFLILSSIYALMRYKSAWASGYVWFAAALSLSVDYPNFFLLFPIGVWALLRIVWVEKEEGRIGVCVSMKHAAALLSVIVPVCFFLWFNYASTGNPLQLAGTLKRVEAISEDGRPASAELSTTMKIIEQNTAKKKTAVGFFKSRNLLNGFYEHFISPDRGMAVFTPIMVLSILGLYYVFKRDARIGNVVLGVAVATVILYSLWGDPYGGWAFGSRYLIPAYAMFAIGLACMAHEWRKNWVFLAIIVFLFAWSSWVNVLGAVTSSRNPPQIEVLSLEKLSGHEEKYSYDRNEQFLESNHSKSFIFNAFAYQIMSAVTYRIVLFGIAFLLGAWMLIGAYRKEII